MNELATPCKTILQLKALTFDFKRYFFKMHGREKLSFVEGLEKGDNPFIGIAENWPFAHTGTYAKP